VSQLPSDPQTLLIKAALLRSAATAQPAPRSGSTRSFGQRRPATVPGMPASDGCPEAEDRRRARDPRVPGSGWVPTSPAFDFPVYGLDASWPGARWLDSFGDQVGDPPRWARLSHQGVDGELLIMVESYSRPVTDELAARWGEPPMADVASHAASILINVTQPVESVPRPDGFLRTLAAHIMEFAHKYAQWPVVRWLMDGAEVIARVGWFAGAWAAVSDSVAEVYLSAVGVGVCPDGLSLARGAGRSCLPLRPEAATAPRRAVGIRASG
jgi:hypothetical protein